MPPTSKSWHSSHRNTVQHRSKHRSESQLQPFDLTRTDMPYYDNMLAKPEYFRKNKGAAFKIVSLTPDEYEKAIEKGFNATHGGTERIQDRITEKYVNEYAQAMKDGAKFPLPVIEYQWNRDHLSFTQEGHHRAASARKLGLAKIPVMIVYPSNQGELEQARNGMTHAVIFAEPF